MVSAHFCHAECSVNDSRYGLQAGVFTHDLDKAWYAFEKLDVGGLVVGHVPSIRVDAQVTFLRSVAMDSRRHASTSARCSVGVGVMRPAYALYAHFSMVSLLPPCKSLQAAWPGSEPEELIR